MVKVYTAYNNFFMYSVIYAIIAILGSFLIKGEDIYIISICLLVYIIIGLITFNDYKIEIYNDKLISYKLFRKPTIFSKEEIIKVHVAKIEVQNRIVGQVRNMIIYMNKGEYKINIHQLENRAFYKDMLEFVQKNNIQYFNDFLN